MCVLAIAYTHSLFPFPPDLVPPPPGWGPHHPTQSLAPRQMVTSPYHPHSVGQSQGVCLWRVCMCVWVGAGVSEIVGTCFLILDLWKMANEGLCIVPLKPISFYNCPTNSPLPPGTCQLGRVFVLPVDCLLIWCNSACKIVNKMYNAILLCGMFTQCCVSVVTEYINFTYLSSNVPHA